MKYYTRVLFVGICLWSTQLYSIYGEGTDSSFDEGNGGLVHGKKNRRKKSVNLLPVPIFDKEKSMGQSPSLNLLTQNICISKSSPTNVNKKKEAYPEEIAKLRRRVIYLEDCLAKAKGKGKAKGKEEEDSSDSSLDEIYPPAQADEVREEST